MDKRGGLEGVVVGETALSLVDGAAGRLVIGGRDVEALAASATFEDVCGLLLEGRLPHAPGRVRAALGAGRVRAWRRLGDLGDALARDDGMEASRASVAHLVTADPFDVIAAVGVFGASHARQRAGLDPVPPDPDLGHATDLLRMQRGAPPSTDEASALDAYLVTVSDHGMNASTFAVRVVASTGSDLVSAVVAGLGALKGPLHGGAPGPVLDLLDAIGHPDRARSFLEAELAAGRRIMGMGHRVYRVRDPRAAVLERRVESLARAGVSRERLSLARAVERTAEALLTERHPTRALRANVEWYTAVLLEALGIPRTSFTATFAAARAAGWAAHYAEERRVGRLIRPEARYVGAMPPAAAAVAAAGASGVPSRHA